MNSTAKLVADNLDRDNGLPTKAIVTLPEGWLTIGGFREALRVQTHTEAVVTDLGHGTAAVARKYIREIITLLNQVYPFVDVELAFEGRFHQCHVNCQSARGSICECKCLYLFHSGGGLPDINVSWIVDPEKGYMIGHEENPVIRHTYKNEGLPESGNDAYYMARLFGGTYERMYMAWYKAKISETVEARHARLRADVTPELVKRLRVDATMSGISFNKLRYRIALIISNRGYGTLRKATWGVKGNAEELIVNYIVEQHDGDIDAALRALAGKKDAA